MILPYLDEEWLYNRIRLDEPWDSEHNLSLSELVVDAYLCPSDATIDPHTNYVAIVGSGMIFQGADGIERDQIQDGL